MTKAAVDSSSLFGAQLSLASDGAGDFVVAYYFVDEALGHVSQERDLKVARVCGADAFTDVSPGVYFAEAVGWAACAEVTMGTSPTLFSPQAPVTRGQITTFLWRYAGEPTGYSHRFSDVPRGTYYADAIAWMAANQFTTGTSATTFDPGDRVTRGQMSAFLWRLAGQPTGFTNRFSDVPRGAYFEDAVAWMAAKGVTTGTSATTFSPNDTLTRAQAVTLLWRYDAISG